MSSITLGATYTDTITGFAGVAIAHTEYLGGSGRTELQARPDRPGFRPHAEWFSDGRLELLPLIPAASLPQPAAAQQAGAGTP
ncbi:hypothetical protein [Pseudoxanthomonas sp. USHLN014]|uniref:hypothetical protein n=1 Tax=Pseudoxanthomonas sp. USHLN014 TaxID=3081297 RepID=UPI00301C850A